MQRSGIAMDSALSPWDTIERLEILADVDASFPRRWRAFVRSCSALVNSDVPPEAMSWSSVADDFDHGRRPAADLDAASKEAWAFFLSVRDSLPWSRQNALLVVMTSLGSGFDASRWHEGAWHFLNCCEAAGVTNEQLAGLLCEHFGRLANGGSGRVA